MKLQISEFVQVLPDKFSALLLSMKPVCRPAPKAICDWASKMDQVGTQNLTTTKLFKQKSYCKAGI